AVPKAEYYLCALPDLTIAPDRLTRAEHIHDKGQRVCPRDLPGPLRGGTAGASEGQAGRRRSRAQEDFCPAAPGGQSHGGIAPQRRRGHQRRRVAQISTGPGAQTGVSAMPQCAAVPPLVLDSQADLQTDVSDLLAVAQ